MLTAGLSVMLIAMVVSAIVAILRLCISLLMDDLQQDGCMHPVRQILIAIENVIYSLITIWAIIRINHE